MVNPYSIKIEEVNFQALKQVAKFIFNQNKECKTAFKSFKYVRIFLE